MKVERIKVGSHDEWLELRRGSIGGSDAPIIVGANSYSSPYMLWLDKMGELPEKEVTEAIKQGTDLEDYVARRFTEETGKKVRRENRVLKNPDYPFAHATVDRWVVGENAGLECKTTSSFNYKKFDDGIFPENYYFQCLHYMAVTGAEKYYLAVLVFSKEFLVFEIERNEEYINSLMEQEKDFWEYVKTKTPPPTDGSKPTDEAISIHYKDVDGDEVVLDCKNRLDELTALKNKRKEIESEIKEIEQNIKSELGSSEYGLADGYKVSWKKQTRRTFDSKRFAKDHEDLDLDDYYKVTESRVLRIKKVKQET